MSRTLGGSGYSMSWYGIRIVYHFGVKSDGTNVFEERIVVFEGASLKAAHKKAHVEARQYSNGEFVIHPDQVGYRQDGDALIDSYEVWSELYEANMSLKDFYEARYKKFNYHPDDGGIVRLKA